MKRYIHESIHSGLVGIWWLYDNEVIGRMVPLNKGYNDGQYIHYHNFKNHSTEWQSVLREQLPEHYDELYNRRFKCIERGRVVYNILTQSYSILCSEAVKKDRTAIHAIVDAFELKGCRVDIQSYCHYYITEPTGNEFLDESEYGF